jgi:hypothetical protein
MPGTGQTSGTGWGLIATGENNTAAVAQRNVVMPIGDEGKIEIRLNNTDNFQVTTTVMLWGPVMT